MALIGFLVKYHDLLLDEDHNDQTLHQNCKYFSSMHWLWAKLICNLLFQYVLKILARSFEQITSQIE